MASISHTAVHIGDTFNRWTITGGPLFHPRPNGYSVVYFPCRCECGTVREVALKHLRPGKSSSCGCLRNERVHVSNGKHWETATPLYQVWCHMRRRCHSENDPAYARYGGRGVVVCDEWRTSYAAFRDWALSHGYIRNLDLDRINNDLGYGPDNCRFTTRVVNNNNRRDNIVLDAFGERKTKAEWARDPRCMVVLGCFSDRIMRGWEPERALSTPSRLTAYRHRTGR